MPSKIKRSSPPAVRRPPSLAKPSLSLRLVACAISVSPLLFDHTASELLYPLFSSAPTHSTKANVAFYSTLAVVFVVQRAFATSHMSWRTSWFLLGVSKIASEGLVRLFGERLLGLGLDQGVLAGRFLVEAVPLLSVANWVSGQSSCKERAKFVPAWFVPLACLSSLLLPHSSFSPRSLTRVPSCYVLQLHGTFLVLVALFARHPCLTQVPRSSRRSHRPPRNPLWRFVLFALTLGLAHAVASLSSHCPTSTRHVPPATSSGYVVASKKGLTGTIVVGEQEIPGPGGVDAEGYRFRYLRADHSLLGGLWTGVSEAELKRLGSQVTEEEVVRRAESIYSTFILQELVRLVVTPEDLPHQSPEQGLVIGLGAGLIARALDHHGVNLTICEIDPVVYEFAREYFAVPEPAQVVLEDAKEWLTKRGEGEKPFDYIVHDVFTGGQVPSALFTREFWSTVKRNLHHSGILAVNFAGSLSSTASKLVLSTLVESFAHCRAFEDNPSSSSNSTVGDDAVLKNIVVFCSPSWFVPIEFRRPVAGDFPPYPSPQIRRKVFRDYASQEVSLDRFKFDASIEDDEGGGTVQSEWILTNADSQRLDKAQLEGTREHWSAMDKVLPKETWASW